MQSNKKQRVCNNCSVSVAETREFNFTWTIPDFKAWFSQIESRILSPLCLSTESKELQWRMSFRRESTEDSSYCSLYLNLEKCPKQQIDVKYAFKMMDAKKKILHMKKFAEKTFKVGAGWGYANFIKRCTLLANMLADNVLIMTCKISVKADIIGDVDKTNTDVGSLKADLASLLKSEKFGDISIKNGNRTIPVHKNILAARSSVFAAMFESMMQERITNVVIIADIKPYVFDEMLRYIYTDKVNDLAATAFELYTAADMYDLQGLISLCRMYILANLSAESLVDAFICADLHKDSEMKSRALLFLSENSRAAIEVTTTAGWQQLLATHPHLVTEAFKALANKVEAVTKK